MCFAKTGLTIKKKRIIGFGRSTGYGLACGRGHDVIMGEFWTGGSGAGGSPKLAAAVAHVYGRKYVGAESFTASRKPFTRSLELK